jgi:hypothetical protein
MEAKYWRLPVTPFHGGLREVKGKVDGFTEHVQVDAVQHQNLLHPFSTSDSEPLREISIFIFPENG